MRDAQPIGVAAAFRPAPSTQTIIGLMLDESQLLLIIQGRHPAVSIEDLEKWLARHAPDPEQPEPGS